MPNTIDRQPPENTVLDNVPLSPDEYSHLFDLQLKILEMSASHDKVSDVLAQLCQLAESLLPNSVASIMLKDSKTGLLSVLSAPSVPQVGIDALCNLQPGPGGGSCGNAVFKNQAQYVQNTFEDERWVDLRQVAYDFNLCSCWSLPVRNDTNEAIGSFTLSSFEHRSPAPFHKKLLETGAAIVRVVLNNQSNEERIQLFSTAIQRASEGIMITDNKNNIIEINPSFEAIYGYSIKDVINRNPTVLSSGKHDKNYYKQMWGEINTNNHWGGKIINKRADGSEITQWMSVSRILGKNQKVQNYLAVFSDLTELKNAQKKIEEMAFIDPITGLYNKTYLEKNLSNLTEKTNLILLNINNFSYINTAYGFDLGDQLLIQIADTLKAQFKSSQLYRLNSDEFAFVINETINTEAYINSIQKYFYSVVFQIKDVTLNISFSYGATYGIENLLKSSALALKQAKQLGKNRYHILNDADANNDESQHKAFIAANNMLHDALENDQVVPFFQGIYNNQSNEIKRFEVLARIKQGDKIITPYHFIEPAKLSGLLPNITKIMIDKSFKIMANNDFSFSINITGDDLSRNYLSDFIEQKLAQYKIAPARVILEILEGVSSSGKKNHIKQLTDLKSKGLSLAIDDFGAEYSNFERILDLEIDFLKIDAKYIKNIDTDAKSFEIVRAITYFAKNSNIPCVAEFVHSEAVQTIIHNLGIDFSQGYYFSEPEEFPQDKAKTKSKS
ncbi:MAG: EAL domain-containing protein [Methyloprofundus sp.]|nr:EAL domain-containing protein [Methyloprofundus sp.]